MDEQLTRMMQFVQSMQSEASAPKGSTCGGGNDMLTQMRPLLPYPKQRMLDLIVKALEMQEIINEMRKPDEL
jgi:hypothetical protein